MPRCLIVLPCYAPDLRLLRVLLPVIEATRRLPGELFLSWSGLSPCPAEFQGPGRIIHNCPELGSWSSISVGEGVGFEFGLAKGFDLVVKLDSDLALIRPGWDRALADAIGASGPTMLGRLVLRPSHFRVRQPFCPALDVLRADQVLELRGRKPGLVERLPVGAYAAIAGGLFGLNLPALEAIGRDGGFAVPEAERLIPEDSFWTQRALNAGVCLVDAPTWQHASEPVSRATIALHGAKNPATMAHILQLLAGAAPALPLVLSGLVAARLATMRQGERTDQPSPNSAKVSQANAAELLNVGLSTLKDAKLLQRVAPAKAEPLAVATGRVER